MEKAYNRQYFVNNAEPELNEDNLNAIDAAIDEIDNRVLEMHTKVFTVMKYEEERRKNESERIEFFEKSKKAEAERIKEESKRRQAETQRIDREDSRIVNERTRNQNENTRIQQENLRQENTAQAITNAQDKTAAAEKATKDCIEVTKQAENALQNQEQLESTLNTAVKIRQDVLQMQSTVTAAKEQVERDKEEIEGTIQNSLLASAEQVLNSVKSYFERAEALYQSMYFDCDGETPSLRLVSPIFIDGATPAVRKMDIGVDFDGGTPTSRLLTV